MILIKGEPPIVAGYTPYRFRVGFAQDDIFTATEMWKWMEDNLGEGYVYDADSFSPFQDVRDFLLLLASIDASWYRVEFGWNRFLLCFHDLNDAMHFKLRWSDYFTNWTDELLVDETGN